MIFGMGNGKKIFNEYIPVKEDIFFMFVISLYVYLCSLINRAINIENKIYHFFNKQYCIESQYIFVSSSQTTETVFEYLICSQFRFFFKSFQLIDLSTA